MRKGREKRSCQWNDVVTKAWWIDKISSPRRADIPRIRRQSRRRLGNPRKWRHRVSWSWQLRPAFKEPHSDVLLASLSWWQWVGAIVTVANLHSNQALHVWESTKVVLNSSEQSPLGLRVGYFDRDEKVVCSKIGDLQE